MRARMFAIFLACVFLHPMSALAQEFGDQMVTIDKAEIKEGEVVVEVLVRGQILAIEEMKGDRFLVSNVAHGWISKKHLKMPKEALDLFTEQIRTNAADAGAYAARANVLQMDWHLDEALKDCDEASRLDPKNTVAYLNRARCWLLKGELDEAIADESDAIEIDSKNAAAYAQRGEDWLRKLDFDKALADATMAIRLAPKYAAAYNTRASARGNKLQIEQAIEDFSEAIRVNPNALGAYEGRGWAWTAKQQYDKAIADYSKLIEICPRALQTHHSRATAWIAKGKYSRAVDDLLEEIRMQPDDSAAYNDLAWLDATCANSAFRDGLKGTKNAAKACELSQWKNAAMLDTLTAANAELGDFEAAVRWQTKARDMAAREAKTDFQSRLDLYKSRKPCREQAKK